MLNAFLILHIAAGFSALLIGSVLMFIKKGGNRHVKLGRIFFGSMMTVVFSALILAYFKENFFLLAVGIFVFYQTFAGWRSANKKSIPSSFWDILILIIALTNGVFMVLSGVIVLIVFGCISIFLCLNDVRSYYFIRRKKPIPKLAWLVRHIGMMTGSYIGTLTAFLVVNLQIDNYQWVVWLAPTAIFVPLMNYWTIRFTKKKSSILTFKNVVITLFLMTTNLVFTQPYEEGGNTRHRFAQLNLGTDLTYFNGENTRSFFLNEADQLIEKPFDPALTSRLIIGGTHFWGHADFYVAFAVNQWIKSDYRSGVETGARYFPWRIKSKRIAPFIGASWLTRSYQQGEGVNQISHDFPVSLGLVYARGNHLFEFSAAFSTKRSSTYYIQREVAVNLSMPNYWLGLGYKYMLETTVGAEKNWENGKTESVTEKLSAKKRLNGLTLAIGPSSAIFTRASDYITSTSPFLGQHKMANIFMELGLGYYWHPIDLQVNLSYRKTKSTLKAFDFQQNLVRRAITLEVYKFLGDYHGFVPFVGGGLSGEFLSVSEMEKAHDALFIKREKLHPGVVFGWDIRPNDLQLWYLRTNLRWFPGLNIQHESGKKINFDQLEFNFIQLVVFPGRFF